MPAATWARTWAREQRLVVAAGLAALRDWQAMRVATEQVWHMAQTGGFMIRTPPDGPALLATLIQPDGDIVVSVSDCLLAPGHRADRDAIAQAHQARVAANLAPLARLARNGAAINALLRLLRRAAVSTAAVQVPVSGGAWLLGGTTLSAFAWSAGAPLAVMVVPGALRHGAAWLIRWRIARDRMPPPPAPAARPG